MCGGYQGANAIMSGKWTFQEHLSRGRKADTGTYLAISFRVRMPFRPLPLSSMLVVTRSILDMIFIHGTSRLTIADMAESTPL